MYLFFYFKISVFKYSQIRIYSFGFDLMMVVDDAETYTC